VWTQQDPYFWSQVTNEAYLSDPQAQNSYSYARNNPTTYTDPTGEYFESGLDIAFIANDLKNINQNIQDKNYGELGWNALSLMGDSIGLAAPGFTGVGLGVKVVGKEAVNVTEKIVQKTVNKNTNDAVGNFGIYEIKVNEELYKYGKADLDRVTQSSNLPTRLHQQLTKLRKQGIDAVGNVIKTQSNTTTKEIKKIENSYIQSFVNKTSKVPPGNQKSFKINK
jgi:hypothetical protein